MRESFLHFIWQFQKFNTITLTTCDGQPIQVFSIGNYNTDAGPDFLNAKLLIGDITWFGHIELHLKASDWDRHKHQHNEAYNNVVLHVVWEHDKDAQTDKGQTLPVLELRKRIEIELLKKCNELIKSPEEIPCVSQFDLVKEIDKLAMLELVGVTRLKQKSQTILQLLNKNKGSWEATTYQLLAQNFGFKANGEPFLKLAQSIKYKTTMRLAQNSKQLEAMIFGMAGFLEDLKEDYAKELKSEFEYLQKKHSLQGMGMIRAEWKYLRLRPGNFPTVRLAQFSAMIERNAKCFDQFIHFNTQKELLQMFGFEVSSYWQDHYDFGKMNSRKKKKIGAASINLVMINTVAPLLAAYAQYTDDMKFMDKAVALLQDIKPEKNHIINMWKGLHLQAKDAFDSQAMIGLRNDFCLKKKCLSCKIGVSLISR